MGESAEIAPEILMKVQSESNVLVLWIISKVTFWYF